MTSALARVPASPALPGADPTQAPATLAALDVSIIIISFNTCNILRECLDSVMVECAPLRAEVLLVDNASTDGSREMVRERFPMVELIESEINLGFGAANNVALERARGRYFVLLNSDAFFAPGALALAIRHMDENPECGLGGCRLVGRDGSWQPSSRCFHSILNDSLVLTGMAARFPKSRLFGRFDRTWADQLQPARVDWVPGAFTILRPDAVRRVGAFDPSFFLYYEEVDLCLRLSRAGIPAWYWPDVVVTHIGGESSRQLKSLEFSTRSAQVVLWRMRSTLLYYRKHHGAKVYLARALETLLYSATVLRNLFSSKPERIGRRRQYGAMLKLLGQAWLDTNGGRVSPPRPW